MSVSFAWQTTSSPGVNFTTVSCSASGAVVAGCIENGYIYVSSDNGATWIQCTAAGSRAWRSIAVSGDGSLIVAGDTAGYLYISTNGGVSWSAKTAAGSRYWFSLAVSSDGSHIAAGAINGYIYTSTDYGATWTERTTSGIRSWYGIWISAAGANLIALNGDGGYIYTSTDHGATWTERTTSGARNWWAVDASTDMQIIVASVAWGGNVYISTDSGATWTASPSTDVQGSHAVAMSADGSTMMAANGSLWSSEDGGATWLEQGVFSTDCYEFAASGGLDYVYVSLTDAGIDAGVRITSGINFEFIGSMGTLGIYANPVFSEGHYQASFLTPLAWPELSGSITVGDSYSASLPVSGDGIGLLATLDSATASFTVAPVEMQATLLMGLVVELATTSTAIGFAGELDFPVAFGGSLVSGGVVFGATLSIGTTFSLVAPVSPVSFSASYLLGSLFSADLIAAGVRLDSGSLASDLEYSGALVALMPWLAADLRLNGGGGVEVWLVNVRTRGMAQYSNYPFQAFAIMGNGLMLAGADDGLYLMDSPTDAGKEVAGVVEVGTTDMGTTEVKYVPDAVLDCEGAGDLYLSVISDGGKIREYSATIDHQGLQQNKRVKLARGIKSRYWSARLSLPVGVSVASLELRPDATRRSAQ